MTIRTQLMLSHFRLLELLGQQENRQSKSVRESLRFFERAPTTSRVPSPIGEQPSGEPLKRKDRKPKPPCLSARARFHFLSSFPFGGCLAGFTLARALKRDARAVCRGCFCSFMMN